MNQSGALFVIATPLGNLEDFSARAKKSLESADLVLAEDTRRTLKLLSHLKIKKPMQSFNEHNQSEKIPGLIEKLLKGQKLALATDAGTPALSDPGAKLVAACHEKGIKVVPVPGPSAITASLSVSGLSADRFLFLGFLPAKSGERKKLLQKYRDFPETILIFEAPHRVVTTIRDLLEIFGDRKACLCRELTKVFEEVRMTSLPELLADLEKSAPKGEISLVIEGATINAINFNQLEDDIEELVGGMVREGKSIKDIVQALGSQTGMPKNLIYKKALEIKNKS